MYVKADDFECDKMKLVLCRRPARCKFSVIGTIEPMAGLRCFCATLGPLPIGQTRDADADAAASRSGDMAKRAGGGWMSRLCA